jgi:hypothetical protein
VDIAVNIAEDVIYLVNAETSATPQRFSMTDSDLYYLTARWMSPDTTRCTRPRVSRI